MGSNCVIITSSTRPLKPVGWIFGSGANELAKVGTRCSVPLSDGTEFRTIDKDALWDKFYTGAPARLRRSVERYSIVKASIRALAERYGINPKTVAKWKQRSFAGDAPMGPKEPRPTLLSKEE